MPYRHQIVLAIVFQSLCLVPAIANVVTLPIHLHRGWNLIALPITPLDDRVDAIFGQGPSRPVWTYENGRYLEANTLEAGRGYAIFAPEPITLTFLAPSEPDESPSNTVLDDGWNLIGVCAPIALPPEAQGLVWALSRKRRFVAATELEPGHAYWLRLSASGTINRGSLAHDEDGDNLPDYWELMWRVETGANDAAADPDGDGLDNRFEYFLGLNPMNADSDSAIDGDDDELPDAWEYRHFGDLVTAGLEEPGQFEYTDFDGDFLNDFYEYLAGTDPKLVDSDGDNVLDYLEDNDLATIRVGTIGVQASVFFDDVDGSGDYTAGDSAWTGANPFDGSEESRVSGFPTAGDNGVALANVLFANSGLAVWIDANMDGKYNDNESQLVGDGLANLEEQLFELHPASKDTDDDGIGDLSEVDSPDLQSITDATDSLDPYISRVGEFDGDDYLTVLANENLESRGNYTVTLWIHPSRDGRQTILEKHARTNGANLVNYRVSMEADGKLVYEYHDDLTKQLVSLRSLESIGAEWSLVAVQHDTGNQIMSIHQFVPDGSNFEQHTVSRVPMGEPKNGLGNLYIGAGYNDTTSTSQEHYRGLIDEVTFWASVLGAEELTRIYNAGRNSVLLNLFPPAGTHTPAAYYTYDDGGQSVEDFVHDKDWFETSPVDGQSFRYAARILGELFHGQR